MPAEPTDWMPHAEAERELSRLLRRSRVALSAYASRVHPDIDPAGYTLLLAVRDAADESAEGAVRAADLAAWLRLHKSTLSRGLAQLELLGLVERAPDPSDARARLVRLSVDGARRMEQVRAERRGLLSTVLNRWDAADLRALAGLLGRLNDDLE